MSAFEARNLACSRAGRRIFAALDFTLPAGGALILRGANGSGKSSLLRVLAGLLAPVGGELHWDGKAVNDDPEAFQDNICYVGHGNAIKPVLTVHENLAFWSKLYPPKSAEGYDGLLDQALETFSLTALRDVPGRQLSSGQSRRLSLSRLITSPARIWLLDEPSVGLDDVSLKRLEAAIAEHRAGGGMVIAATHTPLDIADADLLLLQDFAPPAIDPELLENSW
ncbi:heme ABC exporter ATP-binding protein CcmA [Denitrobaculum tricleocarpae]|uniref:Heme ABC exporter ATP-binding protein CcmA n=1 Tax=Denitrobaculum tricleocarpae TaxID=2591009 RepID=A0A545TR08_9PROT|nr:heme ABC exporter ATP-binding protein CcmA [Denitrobaculum tricleocarpae]TQV79656.1 heme ABC exporter ATP-binding protein CcmA [Denitrobaculum tricleocarpae]